MIKKTLSIVLITIFFWSILYAQETIKLQIGNSELIATKINTQEKYLINKIFYINDSLPKEINKWLLEWSDKVEIYRKVNNPAGYLAMGPDNIKIICKDNYITWLWSNDDPKEPYKKLYIKFTKNIDRDSSNFIEYYLQVKCKKTNFQYKPLDIIDIKEKDVFTNNNLGNFAISSQYTEIPTDEAKAKLMKPNPALQPKFIEIIYYQLITIDKLMNSLESLDLDIDNLFVNNTSRNFYNTWINNFGVYNNVQSFADNFVYSITLKDIWIANDISTSLSAKLLCEYKNPGSCNQTINIEKTGEFDFYTLEEILNNIYVWENSTVNNIKKIYEEIKILKERNYDEISNPSEKSFVSKFMKDTFGNVWEYEDFPLGYWLETRINNINTLESTFESNTDEKINIRWIYNFYYELANINKGFGKGIKLEKWIENWNLEDTIKETALQDIKNKLSLLGDENQLSTSTNLETRIKNDLQNLLRINEEDFSLSLIWCTPGNNIWDFLNSNNILTEYDYYNLLEWLISKAYSSTNRKIEETPDSLYSEWLYNIEWKNNISIYVSNIIKSSDYNNSLGYYFANRNKKPISGKVLIANTNSLTESYTINLSIISSEIPSDASYIGFWLWSNSYNLNNWNYNDGDILTFTSDTVWSFTNRISGYYWTINWQKLSSAEDGDFLYFSYKESNPEDVEQIKKEENLIKIEDSRSYDRDFNDLVFQSNILISDYYSIYLNMSALKNTIYEKYFNITECYNTIDDDNLILYYTSDSFMNDYIDDLSTNENNWFSKNIRWNYLNLPPDISNSLYFSNSIIQTNKRSTWWTQRTVEIKFKTSNSQDLQILYDEGNYIHGMNIFIKDGKIYAGIWGTIDPISNSYFWDSPYTTFISNNIEENTIYTIKIELNASWKNTEEDAFKMYLWESLVWKWKSSQLFFDWSAFYNNSSSVNIWANDKTRFCEDEIWKCSLCETTTWQYRCAWKVKPFQWTIEYIKVWDIAKYSENTAVNPICTDKTVWSTNNRNSFFISCNNPEKTITVNNIASWKYNIKLRVGKEATQWNENFKFYANWNLIWTSMDQGEDCDDQTQNPRIESCWKTIAENIQLNEWNNNFWMKLIYDPNYTGTCNAGSSHIMEIKLEQCQ